MTPSPFTAGADELELAVRATLLIGAAWAAAAILRKAGASAATRHMAWQLGIAALLALPLFWWLTPPLRLPVLPTEASTAAAAALPPPAIAAPPMTSGSMGWDNALLVAYILGVAVMLLRFAICRHMVSGLWRDAEPARDPAWQNILSRVLREMRLSRPVELRIACGPAMPMTWGTLAPKVLLPAESCSWSPERRRLVLLHELAHVARRDSLSRSAASLACALYWFHPGAWLAARQMRMEQEFAADDRVLTAGAPPRTYAASLLDLARRVGERSRPDHAAAMAGMCQLERRLVSITAPVHRERPGPAFLSASAAIATLVTLAVATGVLVKPPSALPDPLRMEAGLVAAPADSIPGEDRSEPEALEPESANLVAGREGRARDLRDGFEDPGAAVAMSQSEGRGLQAGGPQVEPAALGPEAEALQGAPTGQDFREASTPTPRRAVYGPQLPQQAAEPQDSDPRIPGALRRRASGRNGDSEDARDRGTASVPSRSRPATFRISPGLILSSGQIWP